jgi:hypothetical protein
MTTEVATELEQRVAASINAERTAAGLPELRIEAHLNASAQGHSDWMAETGSFSHTGAGGSDATDRIDAAGLPLEGDWRTAENIALRSLDGGLDSGEVDAMHEGLMDSPGHRANILDPDVAYVGIGLSVGTMTVDGAELDVAYLTENFADTDGEVLVQEEVGGETLLQAYQEGEPVGDPQPADVPPDDPGSDPDDPDTPPDPDDDTDDEAVSASAGGCFVATAAYGSRTHPDVVALRRFRDEVLVRHAAGRAFVAAYRVIGPQLARFVSPRRRSGRVARALIAPLARVARRRS